MKRVLVTGSTGFVGRHVVPLLIADGCDVVGVSRADADLREASEAEALVSRIKPTHLIHLAWNTEHGQYWNAPDNHQWAEGTVALARAFAITGGRRFVGAGTCAEYDWTKLDGPCDEDKTTLGSQTIYGRAKIQALSGVARVMEEHSVSWAWGRLFFLYGSGEDERRLVPSVIRSLRAGERARITTGQQIRDFLHVSDAARAFATLLKSDISGPVNIGSGNPLSIRELVEAIARLLDRPDAVEFGAVPLGADEPEFLVASITRLHETGWRPSTGLADGLAAY